MRSIYKLTILLILICGNTLGQNIMTVRVDPSSAKGGDVSDFFKKVNFIPLETTNESLFGQISKLEVTKNLFVIYDVETNAILFFSKEGKFLKKIIPQKNKYFGDFSVNEMENTVTVLSSEKLTTYNLEGTKLKEMPRPDEVERFFSFGNNGYAFNVARSLTFSSADEIRYDVSISLDGNVKERLFEYNAYLSKYDYNLPSNIFSNQGDGTCWFSFPYNYDVSRLDSSGIQETFRFLFPKEFSLPPNFASDSSFRNKRKAYIFSPIQGDTKRLKSISPFFKHQDKLIFHVENISGHWGLINNNLIYDLKTSETISLNSIVGDSLSFDIPILYPKFGQKMHTYKEGAIYTSIPSFMLLQLARENKENDIVPKSLEVFLTKNSSNSNPVIMESFIK